MSNKIDESKQKYKIEFKDKKFKTKKDFQKWLDKTAKYKIEFEDHGQDCLEWWIDEGGEVLHSNLQSAVWNGHLVSLFDLMVGEEIGTLVVEKMATKFYDFVVKKIIKLK